MTTRSGGTLGPRARWLARVVEEGYISYGGLLRRPLWDPEEGVWHLPSEDARRSG